MEETTKVHSGVQKDPKVKDIEYWKKVKKDMGEKEEPNFLNDTIKQLEKRGIRFRDLFYLEDMGNINFTWKQVIDTVNEHAEQQGHGPNVLRWNHTLKEALVLIEIFL